MKTSLYLTDSETASDQSQFMRSRVLRSKCLRGKNCWDSQNSPRNFTTTFQFFSRWIQTRQDNILQRRGTRRTQTHRNTMPCNTTVYTRETFVGDSSGHEEQHCRSLHGTSGWIANTAAREETWTSNPGWYESYEWGRLRNGDDGERRYSASSRAGVQVFSVKTVDSMYTTWTLTSVHQHRSFTLFFCFFSLSTDRHSSVVQYTV